MKLITDNVWGYISKSSKINANKYVASAYLGKGASKLLQLSEDDILVVDASEKNVRTGVTNPFEIEKFIENGVEVFSYNGLHAKVYVFGNIALIGSANASLNSKNNLTECMIETSDNKTVSESRGFIRSLALEPISTEYAKYLQSIFKPPKSDVIKGDSKKEKLGSSIWVQEINDYDYSEEENAAHEVGVEKASEDVQNKEKYCLNSVRYKNTETFIKSATVGDLLIRVHGEDVYPPSRVLGFEKTPKEETSIVVFEEPISPKILNKKLFLNIMESAEFKKIYREFNKPDQKRKILGIWSSVHIYT
ncbi:phospholipase D family protein [Endozoicomonas ascidiicola]|uniref:phospholipase D family protein n=1 Tax=Endozoicomonas ascidiicola TaxID=1698521 RepID=UPI000831946F|nr:phospholipase D family protein [Endozoicomonas ascidiicola]